MNRTRTIEQFENVIINTNAASAALADGTLTVEGTVNDDTIFVDKSGSNFAVYVNGELLGSFKRNQVSSITINGFNGNDLIALNQSISTSSRIHGGSGHDVLIGGNGANELHGGAGDDVLYGGNGADSLFGDAGNDSLFGGNGVDFLDGGDDEDSLFGGNGADLLFNGEHNFE